MKKVDTPPQGDGPGMNEEVVHAWVDSKGLLWLVTNLGRVWRRKRPNTWELMDQGPLNQENINEKTTPEMSGL